MAGRDGFQSIPLSVGPSHGILDQRTDEAVMYQDALLFSPQEPYVMVDVNAAESLEQSSRAQALKS
jgi:hypothetical protein